MIYDFVDDHNNDKVHEIRGDRHQPCSHVQSGLNSHFVFKCLFHLCCSCRLLANYSSLLPLRRRRTPTLANKRQNPAPASHSIDLETWPLNKLGKQGEGEKSHKEIKSGLVQSVSCTMYPTFKSFIVSRDFIQIVLLVFWYPRERRAQKRA